MRIERLEIRTRHVGLTADFYSRTLGLPTSVDPEKATVQVGPSLLVFRQAPDGWTGHYHLAFNIPENRFEDAKEWLAQRTALQPDETFFFERWNAHACYFGDPDGNILEFIARHTLANASDNAFSAEAILTLSEIGLVVEDVPATVDRLVEALGASAYHGRSETFTAVGDAHGLLLVVQTGRVWFGTAGRRARTEPTIVTVRDAADRTQTVTLSGHGLAVSTP